ncbi:hypothetical protein TSUD_06040 [Trifolium subterraneum]|uniref:Uncharacterized protein n=1 Tax=Trifolium subterraneum TaxID=3900 RepID=A0A2Z6MA62_TRISU|nr:hypothetical protein TSUD_06040 [Trifolium subterraneum]
MTNSSSSALECDGRNNVWGDRGGRFEKKSGGRQIFFGETEEEQLRRGNKLSSENGWSTADCFILGKLNNMISVPSRH